MSVCVVPDASYVRNEIFKVGHRGTDNATKGLLLMAGEIFILCG